MMVTIIVRNCDVEGDGWFLKTAMVVVVEGDGDGWILKMVMVVEGHGWF